MVLRFRARELRITPDAVDRAVAVGAPTGSVLRGRAPGSATCIVRHAYDLYTGGDLLALSAEEFADLLTSDREARATLDGLLAAASARPRSCAACSRAGPRSPAPPTAS